MRRDRETRSKRKNLLSKPVIGIEDESKWLETLDGVYAFLSELYLNLEHNALEAGVNVALGTEESCERVASGDQIGQLPSLRYGQLVRGNLGELTWLEDWQHTSPRAGPGGW